MKVKILLTLFVVLLLSSCRYTVKEEMYVTPDIKDKMIEGKNCTWALLWLAPFEKDFANIDKIAADSGIEEIHGAEERIYPYVLWTGYCMRVKGM